MNTPTPTNSETGGKSPLQTLLELLQEGKLEPFEIAILESLANRERPTQPTQALEAPEQIIIPDQPVLPLSTNIEVRGETIDGATEEIVSAETLLKRLEESTIHFGIFGTDGRHPGHGVQFEESLGEKVAGGSWLDRGTGIPDDLSESVNIIWLRQAAKNIITLRVASSRGDTRSGTHTTIFFVLPEEVKREELEKLGNDTEGLKRIMTMALEKGKSPLQGVENGVTKSFLV